MSDDEDWFERALRDAAEDGETDDTTDAEDDWFTDEEDEEPEEPSEGPAEQPPAPPDTEADSPFASDTAEGEGMDEEDGSLFSQDFASEFGGASAPGGGDFGGAEDTGDQSPEMSMGSDEEEFADEAVESEIPRIDLGIDGLDAMIRGGIPERSLMVAIGSAGCGKTTFGLQFLNKGLSEGEKGIFITLEESKQRIIRSATEKGFKFDEYVESGQLAVVDIDAIEMANSLTSIRSELPRLIDEFGASRLVLDSVSLLEMMFQNNAVRRNEIYTFTKALKKAGITTMLTSEASETNPYTSRHGIVEYLTDAVFVLQYVRPQDFQETRLAIEIQKIRDAHHSRETKPYEIGDDGISVYRRATIF